MEPPSEQIEQVVRYVITCGIKNVFDDVGGYWWVAFEGSKEAWRLTRQKPDFHPGEKVLVSIQRVQE